MVKFANLGNSIKERKIREVIVSGKDKIVVYEPSVEDVDNIINYQETFVKGLSTGEITIDGVDIVKVLFPMLTDIEGIDELTDEEINAIVAEPSLAYLQVEQVIKGIIVEIYKTLVITSRTELIEMDLIKENENVQNTALDAIMKQAAKVYGAEDLLQKIENASENLRKAQTNELQKDLDNVVEFKPKENEDDTTDQLKDQYEQKADKALEEYKAMFSK